MQNAKIFKCYRVSTEFWKDLGIVKIEINEQVVRAVWKY